MFNRNHVIASIREIRYSLNGITQKQWITCGTVFATVYLLSAIYILSKFFAFIFLSALDSRSSVSAAKPTSI